MTELAIRTSVEDTAVAVCIPTWLEDTYIVEAPTNWSLCTLSEAYLKEAFDNGGTVTLVNDTLLVKPVGKLAGLCMEDVYDRQGNKLFQKGVWYCPVDESRQVLLNNFGLGDTPASTGYTRITLPNSKWCKMRIAVPERGQPLDQYISEISEKVASLGQFFSPRTSYHHENMPGIIPVVQQTQTSYVQGRRITAEELGLLEQQLQRFLRGFTNLDDSQLSGYSWPKSLSNDKVPRHITNNRIKLPISVKNMEKIITYNFIKLKNIDNLNF